jgi:hypothetical protein
MFWLVPDCMGTCHASKREGPGRGATEEVVGLVRGPSEGFGMIGPLETVESGRGVALWPLAARLSLSRSLISATAAVSCKSAKY